MKTIIFLLLSIISYHASAQVTVDSEYYKQFKSYDEAIFDKSFNNCQHDELIALLPDDFEFYHDVGGLETNKDNFIATIEKNICGDPDRKPIRKLVDGTLELHLLKKNGTVYGAIQNGVHEFYLKEKDKPLYKTGIADFTSVWMLENDKWYLSRVLSYNHRPASD